MKNLLVRTDDNSHRIRSQTLLFGVLLLLLTLSLGACDLVRDSVGKMDNVQIGMVEHSGFNQAEASFHTLTGRKAWRERVEAGQTLSLTYAAGIEKGSLSLLVENPQDETVWQTELEAGEETGDEVELVAEESGTYTIAVVGEDAGGKYELAWEQAE